MIIKITIMPTTKPRVIRVFIASPSMICVDKKAEPSLYVKYDPAYNRNMAARLSFFIERPVAFRPLVTRSLALAWN